MAELSQDHPIVLFDGVCNLCNGFVRFLMARDPHRVFRFASLQSDVGVDLLRRLGQPVSDLSTVVVIENGRVYERSSAALRIVRRLRFPWPILAVFWIVPRPLRDAVYSWIGRHRYQWFGKTETCAVPSESDRAQFLDQASR